MFTVDEQTQLDIAMKQLSALTGLVEAAQKVNSPTIDTKKITLDDLQPTGELDKVAETIRNNVPYTEEEFDLMVKEAEAAISTESRVDGALQNITLALKQITSIVLPIIKGAL